MRKAKSAAWARAIWHFFRLAVPALGVCLYASARSRFCVRRCGNRWESPSRYSRNCFGWPVSEANRRCRMAAMTHGAPFRRGELVEVRPPLHILRTLDGDGAIGGLPFMPEMLGFVGKRFRVEKRILKTCVSIGNSTNMRVFNSGAIVTLEGVRCSGEGHDGCQKLCAIFWHEEWLRKVDDSEPGTQTNPEGAEQLGSRLKTTVDSTKYSCQASELLKITSPLSRWERFGRCFAEVRTGNCSVWEMALR